MPFVKLDCGILNSTLWLEREMREVFITALLMAEPIELKEPIAQIAITSLELTGWSVPPGWYGFVAAAGVGILHRAKVPDDVGVTALERLGQPEQSSRSPEFDGRRLVRINGGFIVLNFMKYRDRDYTAALRSARYRQKQKIAQPPSHRDDTASRRNITQAEAEAEYRGRDPSSAATRARAATRVTPEGDARSGRPIFTGQRLVVHEFMFDDCTKLLQEHTNDFDLHGWFDELDSALVAKGLVIGKRDGGAWLQSQLVAEAQRRGIPLAMVQPIEKVAGKLSQRLMSARANIQREAKL